MKKDAERIPPQTLNKVHDLEADPEVPDFARVGEGNRMTTVLRRGFQQATKIRITTDNAVKGHHICLREIIRNVRKICVDKIYAFCMSPPRSFLLCLFQIRGGCIHMRG